MVCRKQVQKCNKFKVGKEKCASLILLQLMRIIRWPLNSITSVHGQLLKVLPDKKIGFDLDI